MFHKKLKELSDNPDFKSWKEAHKDFFLAHAFLIESGEWQFGFYNPKTEKMVTFICGESIAHSKEEDILKSKNKIAEIHPDNIKIELDKALETAKDIIKKHYPKQLVSKNFIIIQKIDGQAVYNITFLAQNFNTVNIKINAASGEVLHHSAQVLASF